MDYYKKYLKYKTKYSILKIKLSGGMFPCITTMTDKTLCDSLKKGCDKKKIGDLNAKRKEELFILRQEELINKKKPEEKCIIPITKLIDLGYTRADIIKFELIVDGKLNINSFWNSTDYEEAKFSITDLCPLLIKINIRSGYNIIRDVSNFTGLDDECLTTICLIMIYNNINSLDIKITNEIKKKIINAYRKKDESDEKVKEKIFNLIFLEVIKKKKVEMINKRIRNYDVNRLLFNRNIIHNEEENNVYHNFNQWLDIDVEKLLKIKSDIKLENIPISYFESLSLDKIKEYKLSPIEILRNKKIMNMLKTKQDLEKFGIYEKNLFDKSMFSYLYNININHIKAFEIPFIKLYNDIIYTLYKNALTEEEFILIDNKVKENNIKFTASENAFIFDLRKERNYKI